MIKTEKVQKLKELIDDGASISAAAREVGMSRVTAYKYLAGKRSVDLRHYRGNRRRRTVVGLAGSWAGDRGVPGGGMTRVAST